MQIAVSAAARAKNHATKAIAHETKIRRWSTFTSPYHAARAAHCGLVLHRRLQTPAQETLVRSNSMESAMKANVVQLDAVTCPRYSKGPLVTVSALILSGLTGCPSPAHAPLPSTPAITPTCSFTQQSSLLRNDTRLYFTAKSSGFAKHATLTYNWAPVVASFGTFQVSGKSATYDTIQMQASSVDIGLVITANDGTTANCGTMAVQKIQPAPPNPFQH